MKIERIPFPFKLTYLNDGTFILSDEVSKKEVIVAEEEIYKIITQNDIPNIKFYDLLYGDSEDSYKQWYGSMRGATQLL